MVSRRVVRRRRALAGAVVLLVALAVLVTRGGAGDEPAPVAGPSPSASPSPSPTAAAAAAVARPPAPTPRPRPSPQRPTEGPDALAGVLSPDVPEAGTGRLVTVPGTRAAAGAPAGAETVQVRVQVEEGLPARAAAVATTVMDVLQDPRGWSSQGWAFARTDDTGAAPAPDVTVVVASPRLTEQMCAPLDTDGVLSCRQGDRVVLTWHRWVRGAEAYGEDRVGYRRYLVTHEVGHFLGHGHEPCPAPGAEAPVMMQQTKGLQGCAPNPWPLP